MGSDSDGVRRRLAGGERKDVDTGDVDSGNSTSHSPAEDKNSLMLTTSYAPTEGKL